MSIDPNHALAHLKLGQSYFKSGAYQNAINQLQKIIQLDPNYASPYYWLGVVFLKQDFDRKAVGCFKKAVTLDPAFAMAHYHLGLLYLKEGKLALSRDCFYKVIAGNNSDWRAWGNLCMVLRDLGELNEAKLSGHRATSLNTDSFQAWHNLGNVYKDLGCYHESISCYEKARSLKPDSDVTLTGMGISFQRIGDNDRAVKSFKMALKYNPSAGTAISNLLNISMMECDWDKSSCYEKMIHNLTVESLCIGQVPAESPFLNLSRCDDPELNMAVARAWSHDIDNKMAGTRDSLRFQYPRNYRSKIRIGYLSNNFSDHPTAHITRRLYQLHDRSRFEIFCFSYGPEDNSRYRHSIRDGCDKFIDIRELSNAEAAKAINDHGVDILIDLVGFMKGERMAVAALRPAPVQVRWLGMAGTSGADFFDYLVTDRTVTTENQARFYSEKFVYLPHCYQINDNQPFMDEKNCRRLDYGLPEGTFVFSCFNTSYKIDAEIFAVWMNILRRSTGSVLWLMANSRNLKDNLKKSVTENGIDAQRLIFAEKIPKHEHLSRLSLADLGLDTCRVSGAATTSDALWAGVPVLTICGKHFASRMSSSILKAAGLHALITHSLEEYEDRAVKLAEEKSTLARIKSTLLATGHKSHLFNTEGIVHHLEKAYGIIWQRYLEGERPCMVDVGNVKYPHPKSADT
ncbi:MAG: tetratricopeptide repeat protein [Desulfosarcina sp.]|nr:tetratricopeptide repeat protein [Desulfosarcina sp.]